MLVCVSERNLFLGGWEVRNGEEDTEKKKKQGCSVISVVTSVVADDSISDGGGGLSRGIRRFLFPSVEVAGIAVAVFLLRIVVVVGMENLFVFLVFFYSALLVKGASWVSETCNSDMR